MGPVRLRPARADDANWCVQSYSQEVAATERTLDDQARAEKIARFKSRLEVEHVRIIARGDRNVGWMQLEPGDEQIFIVQLFVDGPLRNGGIGTAALHLLLADADANHLKIRLGVRKTNPARRLYPRLGFITFDEDDRKLYMVRAPLAP